MQTHIDVINQIEKFQRDGARDARRQDVRPLWGNDFMPDIRVTPAECLSSINNSLPSAIRENYRDQIEDMYQPMNLGASVDKSELKALLEAIKQSVAENFLQRFFERDEPHGEAEPAHSGSPLELPSSHHVILVDAIDIPIPASDLMPRDISDEHAALAELLRKNDSEKEFPPIQQLDRSIIGELFDTRLEVIRAPQEAAPPLES